MDTSGGGLGQLKLHPGGITIQGATEATAAQLSQVQSLATLQAKLTAMASQIQQQQQQQLQQKGGASPLVAGKLDLWQSRFMMCTLANEVPILYSREFSWV